MNNIIKIAYLPVITITLLLLSLGFALAGLTEYQNYPLILAIVIGGIPLLYETLREVAALKFNVDIVAIISIWGSLLVNEYVAGAIIVLMMSGGKALEQLANRRARSAISKLVKLLPQTANLSKGNGDFEPIQLSDVKVDDVLLIKPGDVVGIDGIILSGESAFDQQSVTGESIPVHKERGDQVIAGSVNTTGAVEMKVTRTADLSTLSQMIKLLQHAEEHKAKVGRLADQMGAWFTPVTILVAALSYLLTSNINYAYAVFVIATPCPLLLATPIAIVSAIARAATLGVVVRSGQSLEAASQVDTMVFDKTGTLTTGFPTIIDVVSVSDKFSKQQVMQLAASIDQYSNHIVARSMTRYALQQNVDLLPAQNFSEVPGRGVVANINGQKVQFGSTGFVQDNGVLISADLLAQKLSATSLGQIMSWVTVEKEPIGYVLLSDELRPDALNLIDSIKELDIKKIMMLTGDTSEVAIKVASQVGISDVVANATPQMKLQTINKLAESGFKVAMIGDGINDAPSLAAAHLGVAISGTGETVASESADVVLLSNDIGKLVKLVSLSRESLAIARNGIIAGMGLSFLGMLLAGAGLLSPTAGAIAQELIDLGVILNALRVFAVKLS